MEKKIEFVPVEYDYFDFKGRSFIRIIGRDSGGRKVCVVDSYEANFYLILRDGYDGERVVDKIKDVEVEKGGRVSKVLKCEVMDKHFLGEKRKVIRVWISNHKDAAEMVSALGDLEEVDFRREFDLGIITKYIKEKKVDPLVWQNVETGKHDAIRVVEGLDVEEVYFAEKITPLENGKEFVPKILSYDIETTGVEIGEGEILMVSYCCGDKKGVISWKDIEGGPDYVEVVEDEAAMIERFCEVVKSIDADILTGYFSDGFDLPYLKARADKFKVTLDLGVNGRGPNLARGRIPSG